MAQASHSSLRDSILATVGAFLYTEKFDTDEITQYGILEILDLISDYYEEGKPLFPEVLITNDLSVLKSFPNKELIIKSTVASVKEFKTAVKLCAPLAVSSWIIFIEIKNEKMCYGLASAEMKETSPSMFNQTVGELKIDLKGATIAYLRNIGQKVVELTGFKKREIISLNLSEPKSYSLAEINQLSSKIAEGCQERIRTNIETFLEKLIDEALKTGHGNLIGIVDDDEEVINELTTKLKISGGVFLSKPIDFQMLIEESEENSGETSVNLRAHAALLKGMLNHDGITIISNKARVLGYHLLIDVYHRDGDDTDGGSRSKAHNSMINCAFFKFCFYKSQDGHIKVWNKNE